MKVLNRNYYTREVGIAVAMSAASTSVTAETGDIYSDTVEHASALHLKKKDSNTGQATCRIRVPVAWDEEAKQRFDELMVLKSQKKTTPQQDREFSELYDARSEHYDRIDTEQAIAEFRRKRAFNELIEAFDKYVIAEKIPD